MRGGQKQLLTQKAERESEAERKAKKRMPGRDEERKLCTTKGTSKK